MRNPSARVPLSGGNIRNFHFYLRSCPELIPAGGIGGKNRSDLGQVFTVEFEPGSTVECDVDGDKMILRNRKAIREFFERSNASEGNVVVIERSAERALRISLDAA